MIQAPREHKQVVGMINSVLAGRQDRCVGSKSTSVSKSVLLLGPLHGQSQPSFLRKTALFTGTSYVRSNLFLAIKIISSSVLTTHANWFQEIDY